MPTQTTIDNIKQKGRDNLARQTWGPTSCRDGGATSPLWQEATSGSNGEWRVTMVGTMSHHDGERRVTSTRLDEDEAKWNGEMEPTLRVWLPKNQNSNAYRWTQHVKQTKRRRAWESQIERCTTSHVMDQTDRKIDIEWHQNNRATYSISGKKENSLRKASTRAHASHISSMDSVWNYFIFF
jgi:hypothetical protein